MRFLLGSVLGLAVGLAVTPTVVANVECWPNADCLTYTPRFAGSGGGEALDFKTPWSGQLGVDKFNSHGTRTLTGVKIKTILYFNSSLYVTRTDATTFDGTANAGMMLHMDLASNPGLLGQYWGRWGNYEELDNNVNNDKFPHQGQNGQDVTEAGENTAAYPTSPPLFVDYTYPLFDVVGAVDFNGSPLPGLPTGLVNDGPVWAYYIPNANPGTTGWPQYYYGKVSIAKYVERKGDDVQPTDGNDDPISQYFTNSEEKSLNQPDAFPFTEAFPVGPEQFLGNSEFNRFDESLAFEKTIDVSDLDGGIGRNISAQTMLDLFDRANGGGSQIMFDVAAKGFYVTAFEGGNAAFRQVSVAYVAVRVEYTFTCTACGDPQFGGFQGQSFQVHGYPGSYFNLFSAPSFQMNGRFTYLATGHCKYNHTACWTHPGTYIDDVTFVVDELLIRVTAGPVGSGSTVLINNEPFHGHKHTNDSDAKALTHADEREFIPTKFYDPNTRVTVYLKSPLEVIIRTDLVSFAIHNADHFFNVDSQLLVRPLLKLGNKPSPKYPDPATGKPGFPDYPIHGFIGQTWANKIYNNKRQYQGEPDDYVEPRPYATESLYSQYHKQFDDTITSWDN